MILAEEAPDSELPGSQGDGIEELPDGTPHQLQHSRELRRDQRLACGGRYRCGRALGLLVGALMDGWGCSARHRR